jgi:hypothetical protein
MEMARYNTSVRSLLRPTMAFMRQDRCWRSTTTEVKHDISLFESGFAISVGANAEGLERHYHASNLQWHSVSYEKTGSSIDMRRQMGTVMVTVSLDRLHLPLGLANPRASNAPPSLNLTLFLYLNFLVDLYALESSLPSAGARMTRVVVEMMIASSPARRGGGESV